MPSTRLLSRQSINFENIHFSSYHAKPASTLGMAGYKNPPAQAPSEGYYDIPLPFLSYLI